MPDRTVCTDSQDRERAARRWLGHANHVALGQPVSHVSVDSSISRITQTLDLLARFQWATELDRT